MKLRRGVTMVLAACLAVGSAYVADAFPLHQVVAAAQGSPQWAMAALSFSAALAGIARLGATRR